MVGEKGEGGEEKDWDGAHGPDMLYILKDQNKTGRVAPQGWPQTLKALSLGPHSNVPLFKCVSIAEQCLQ